MLKARWEGGPARSRILESGHSRKILRKQPLLNLACDFELTFLLVVLAQECVHDGPAIPLSFLGG